MPSPIRLGEKTTAIINARYYFGAPVAEAKVKYKLTRTGQRENWFPVGAWDWCFGPGYWWYSYDYEWLPGWNRWGFQRPFPSWMVRAQEPPELIAEVETEILPDGTPGTSSKRPARRRNRPPGRVRPIQIVPGEARTHSAGPAGSP